RPLAGEGSRGTCGRRALRLSEPLPYAPSCERRASEEPSIGEGVRYRFAENLEERAERVVRDVERRHHVERVAERAELRAELERASGDGPALLAEVAALAEIDGGHHAEAPRTADARDARERGDAAGEALGLGRSAREDVLVAVDGEDLARDGG